MEKLRKKKLLLFILWVACVLIGLFALINAAILIVALLVSNGDLPGASSHVPSWPSAVIYFGTILLVAITNRLRPKCPFCGQRMPMKVVLKAEGDLTCPYCKNTYSYDEFVSRKKR